MIKKIILLTLFSVLLLSILSGVVYGATLKDSDENGFTIEISTIDIERRFQSKDFQLASINVQIAGENFVNFETSDKDLLLLDDNEETIGRIELNNYYEDIENLGFTISNNDFFSASIDQFSYKVKISGTDIIINLHPEKTPIFTKLQNNKRHFYLDEDVPMTLEGYFLEPFYSDELPKASLFLKDNRSGYEAIDESKLTGDMGTELSVQFPFRDDNINLFAGQKVIKTEYTFTQDYFEEEEEPIGFSGTVNITYTDLYGDTSNPLMHLLKTDVDYGNVDLSSTELSPGQENVIISGSNFSGNLDDVKFLETLTPITSYPARSVENLVIKDNFISFSVPEDLEEGQTYALGLITEELGEVVTEYILTDDTGTETEISITEEAGSVGFGEGVEIDDISFNNIYNDAFELDHGILSISGKGLDEVAIEYKVKDTADIDVINGTETPRTTNQIRIRLSTKEIAALDQRIFINGVSVFLPLEDVPLIDEANPRKLLIGSGDPLIFGGIDLIDIQLDTTIGLELEANKNVKVGLNGNNESITYENSNMIIQEDFFNTLKGETTAIVKKTMNMGDYTLDLKNTYEDIIRCVEDIDLPGLELVPTIGSAGSQIRIMNNEEDIPSGNYDVYFLKKTDGSQPLTSDIQGKNLEYIESANEIRFDVPDIGIGQYDVLLVKKVGETITGETLVTTGDKKFLIIDSTAAPSITNIEPKQASTNGGKEVKIDGRYILSIGEIEKIVSLYDGFDKGLITVDPNQSSPQVFELEYSDTTNFKEVNGDYIVDSTGTIEASGLYNGVPVKIRREIEVIIGDSAEIIKDEGYYLQNETTDLVTVITPSGVDDGSTDINVTITTQLIEKAGEGRTIEIVQEATAENEFIYYPATVYPQIDSVVPELVSVFGETNDLKTDAEILLSIKGSDFMVGLNETELGVLKKYPSVFFVQNSSDDGEQNYTWAFLPNKKYEYDSDNDGENEIFYGGIQYRKNNQFYLLTENGSILLADDGQIDNILSAKGQGAPIDFNMKVLSNQNELINGKPENNANGKNLGSEILLSIPDNLPIPDISARYIQVKNIKYDSEDTYGNTTTFNQSITFIKAINTPNIESVVPNVVNVEGGQEIKIRGSNFSQEIMLYLDGDRIENFQREQDELYEVITFTVPKTPVNRPGTTLINLVNPDGGMTSYPFIFVEDDQAGPLVAEFQPKKGTENTLVVLTGENFLESNPSVDSFDGINIYKLIGTRVFLAGEDINEYNYNNNRIDFIDYDFSLGSSGQALSIKDGAIEMDPNVESVILENKATVIETTNKYFLIREKYDGVHLLNGSDDYLLTEDNKEIGILEKLSSGIYTEESIGTINQSGTDMVLNFNTGEKISLKFITPYIVDQSTGDIIGDRTQIVNGNQINFTVLEFTIKGYKDLRIQNPDTKKVEFLDEDGFYYYSDPYDVPVIEDIKPNVGSIVGGYVVDIYGKNFNENTSVYIGGQKVSLDDTSYDNIQGKLSIIMPQATRTFNGRELTVPVVVVNSDGGSDVEAEGFTYVVTKSNPVLTDISPTEAPAQGQEIIAIKGSDFRYREPDESNALGFIDLIDNERQDDLLALEGKDGNVINWTGIYDLDYNKIKAEDLKNNIIELIDEDGDGVTDYYESPLLPKVYFGQEEAKIIEFQKDIIRVQAPRSTPGQKDVFLINNDYGISNRLNFTFNQTNPVIDKIVPNIGSYKGNEMKDIYGEGFISSDVRGYFYKDEPTDDSLIEDLDFIEGIVRFGRIGNTDLPISDENSGQIVSKHLKLPIELEGGLTVDYRPYEDAYALDISIEQENKIYKRTFTNYDNSNIYIPIEMLKNDGNYYHPFGYTVEDPSKYTKTRHEMLRIRVNNAFGEDERLIVERGYAPEVDFISSSRVRVHTPAYHTIDSVQVSYINPDEGSSSTSFEYTNPDSNPKILKVLPMDEVLDETNTPIAYTVNGTVNGGQILEIIGEDFRKGVQVLINDVQATVIEIDETSVQGENFQSITVEVPSGSENDLDQNYPIVVINSDTAVANSTILENLIEPLDGTQKLPIYYNYKKPLSGPQIDEILPSETSVAGKRTIEIYGEDFRDGAVVTIGSRGGVPITDLIVNDVGSLITFETPENLTVGIKDIQVMNKDFGTAVVRDGLKIVSNPTLNETIYNEDGSEIITRVSVEGGDVITLDGDGFMEGATVLFGGTLTKQTSETQSDYIGLDSSDVYWVIENPIEATAVEYIDSETLKVTTPEISKEKDYNIIVLNEDKGFTDDKVSTSYRLPIPSDPTGLEAEIIDNRYVRIFNYTAESVEYYEIYSYLGKNSKTRLKNNDYKDFTYVDTTEIEPYRITSLPGVENIRPDEKLSLVLKAVNEYGPSSWSDIVTLDYDDLEDVEEIGPPDADGDLGVPEGQNYDYDATSEAATVNITDKTIDSTVVIELSDLEDLQKKLINVPGNKVRSNTSLIGINFGDTQIQFTPISLNTQEFRNIDFYNDSYGRIANEWIDDDYSSVLKGYLPRGKKPISKVYSLDFYALNNTEDVSIQRLNSDVNFSLRYNPDYLSSGQNVGLFRFDGSRSWVEVDATHNESRNALTTAARTAGKYIILKY